MPLKSKIVKTLLPVVTIILLLTCRNSYAAIAAIAAKEGSKGCISIEQAANKAGKLLYMKLLIGENPM